MVQIPEPEIFASAGKSLKTSPEEGHIALGELVTDRMCQ